jgi:opacity protein-like surface antigen
MEVRVPWSRSAVGVVVASLVAAASGAAQGTKVQFGVAAGLAVPTGDYHAAASGEGFNSGGEALVFVTLKPQGPVGLRVDATYGANGANDRLKANLTPAFGPPSDERTKLLGGNADVIYAMGSGSRVQPYLLGGIGVYHVTISVTSGGSTEDNAATKFAWNVGGGLGWRIGRAALFFEARHVNVAAKSGFPRTTFLPITAGVRFGGR